MDINLSGAILIAIHSFIHSGHFYSALQVLYYSEMLPTTARILCRSFTPKRTCLFTCYITCLLITFVSSELRLTRNLLLDVMANPNNEPSALSAAVNNYLGLLDGFIVSLDEEKAGDSKLRHAVRYRWTNTLLGNTPT